jgi:hypothetical protein
MIFGITLPNRGINLDICRVGDLLEPAGMADASPLLDSVWVGGAGGGAGRHGRTA